MPMTDGTCDPTLEEMAFASLGVQEKYMRFEQGDHLIFAGGLLGLPLSDAFLDRLV